MKKLKNKRIILAVMWSITLFAFSLSLAQVIIVTPKNQREAAKDLAKRWIINNHEDNPSLYNFNEKVVRQELWAITRGIAKLEKSKKCENIFKDLTNIIPNSWACVNIEPLVKNNFIARNDYFRPEENVTKAEVLWMLIKALWFEYKYNSDLNTSWQEQIVDFASKKWIIEKFTDFNKFATRWFVFKVADVKKIEVPDKKKEKKKIELKEDKFYSDEVKIK